jgi:hypothetical protein
LKGSYKGSEKDLRQLRGCHRGIRWDNAEGKVEILLRPRVQTGQAPERIRTIWESTRIEESEKDRETELRRRARTGEEEEGKGKEEVRQGITAGGDRDVKQGDITNCC